MEEESGKQTGLINTHGVDLSAPLASASGLGLGSVCSARCSASAWSTGATVANGSSESERQRVNNLRRSIVVAVASAKGRRRSKRMAAWIWFALTCAQTYSFEGGPSIEFQVLYCFQFE